jgi:hypothetical protein
MVLRALLKAETLKFWARVQSIKWRRIFKRDSVTLDSYSAFIIKDYLRVITKIVELSMAYMKMYHKCEDNGDCLIASLINRLNDELPGREYLAAIVIKRSKLLASQLVTGIDP